MPEAGVAADGKWREKEKCRIIRQEGLLCCPIDSVR